MGPKIIKGSPKKLLYYYFIDFFSFFFTLAHVGTGQIYCFKKFINLPSINLKSFQLLLGVHYAVSVATKEIVVLSNILLPLSQPFLYYDM